MTTASMIALAIQRDDSFPPFVPVTGEDFGIGIRDPHLRRMLHRPAGDYWSGAPRPDILIVNLFEDDTEAPLHYVRAASTVPILSGLADRSFMRTHQRESGRALREIRRSMGRAIRHCDRNGDVETAWIAFEAEAMPLAKGRLAFAIPFPFRASNQDFWDRLCKDWRDITRAESDRQSKITQAEYVAHHARNECDLGEYLGIKKRSGPGIPSELREAADPLDALRQMDDCLEWNRRNCERWGPKCSASVGNGIFGRRG
jgi:hypothetical protein